MKMMKMKAYRPRLLHTLKEPDYARRMEYCTQIMDMGAFVRIVYSDEATLHLNGLINRHNSVYWAQENPHVFVTEGMKSPGLNVWGGIWQGGIIGPFFIERNLTGDSYRQLLLDHVFPAIAENGPPNAIFQQDGAPPHYALHVRQLLDERFPGRWIGRGGPIQWAARSCDLTPMDFSVWSLVRQSVYAVAPVDLEDLRSRIEIAFEQFTPDLCQAICDRVPVVCAACIEQSGRQFEHILKG